MTRILRVSIGILSRIYRHKESQLLTTERDRGSFRARRHGEDGFTLIEMTLTISILAVVFTMTIPIVMMYFHLNNDVQQTYTATNQVILASEEITQYIHEAVAPCPSGSTHAGCSTVPFGASTQSSLTFWANTNNTNGPSEVVIAVSGTTLTAYVYSATANTCPFNGSTTTMCTYTAAPHLLTTVTGLSTTTPFTYIPSSGISGGTTCDGSNAPSFVCTNSYANPISAVDMSLQLLTSAGAEPDGYQTTAYALAPQYNGAVG
jgi:prepilin-type N-terminal cleavage/methylation domain-containing protein